MTLGDLTGGIKRWLPAISIVLLLAILGAQAFIIFRMTELEDAADRGGPDHSYQLSEIENAAVGARSAARDAATNAEAAKYAAEAARTAAEEASSSSRNVAIRVPY